MDGDGGISEDGTADTFVRGESSHNFFEMLVWTR
jgi:hypothetical protein